MVWIFLIGKVKSNFVITPWWLRAASALCSAVGILSTTVGPSIAAEHACGFWLKCGGVLQARDDCGQHPYPGWAAWRVLAVGGIMVSRGRPQPSGSFRGRWSSTLVVFDMRYGGCPFLSGHFFIQKRFILKIIF